MSNKKNPFAEVLGEWTSMMSVMLNPDGTLKEPIVKAMGLSEEAVSKIYDILEKENAKRERGIDRVVEGYPDECDGDCDHCEHFSEENLLTKVPATEPETFEPAPATPYEELKAKKQKEMGFHFNAKYVVTVNIWHTDDHTPVKFSAHLVPNKAVAQVDMDKLMAKVIATYGNCDVKAGESKKKYSFTNEKVTGIIKMTHVKVTNPEFGSMLL